MYSDEQPVYTVNLSDLGRNPSRVMSWVGEGSRVFVLRYGLPIAVITPIDRGIELLVAGSEALAKLRREALEEMQRAEAAPMPER